MPFHRGRPIKLQDILSPYFRKTGLSRKLEENRIICLWPEIVGKAISENTQPLGLRNRILQVKVINSVWMQQLQFMKGIILQKIKNQDEGKGIDDIKFYLGEIEKSQQEAAKKSIYFVPREALGKEEKEKIEKEVEEVQDPEIRESLARLFARGIQARTRITSKK